MNYPTLDEVESASHEQICRWYRFLHSPGWNAIGTGVFEEALEREIPVMNRIVKLFDEGNGFDPELSKSIGWEEPK